MKITQIKITGLAGGTVEGGWADELKPTGIWYNECEDSDCIERIER